MHKESSNRKTLEDKFRQIYRKHDKAIRTKSATLVLGSSIIRALKKGIKEDLRNELSKITIKDLIVWSKNESTFRKSFLNKVSKIEKIIGDSKKGNKYAHAPKILALYCRDLLAHSWSNRRMNRRVYEKIERLLFCPIDSIVINELRSLEGGKRFLGKVKSMKDMQKNDFMRIQDWLMEAANKTEVPRIWFDDVWVKNTR